VVIVDASSAASGWLDSPRTPHLAGAPCSSQAGWKRKKKFFESSRTLPRELEELDAARTTLGGAALDAGGRSGPRWTGDA